jgi:hypothetical protein
MAVKFTVITTPFLHLYLYPQNEQEEKLVGRQLSQYLRSVNIFMVDGIGGT